VVRTEAVAAASISWRIPVPLLLPSEAQAVCITVPLPPPPPRPCCLRATAVAPLLNGTTAERQRLHPPLHVRSGLRSWRSMHRRRVVDGVHRRRTKRPRWRMQQQQRLPISRLSPRLTASVTTRPPPPLASVLAPVHVRATVVATSKHATH
jgi:hypothetical protein